MPVHAQRPIDILINAQMARSPKSARRLRAADASASTARAPGFRPAGSTCMCISGMAARISRSARRNAAPSAASRRWSMPALAGEANFHGFREYIIEPARERIKAFLNLGSIGLVACNRVPNCAISGYRPRPHSRGYAENSEHIVGIKVRASHVITGSWGVTPVKLGKKIAKILKLPMMVHVGEPPALYDEVLEILGPGDVVTHCFNGKAGSSIMEDEDLFNLAERCAGEGVRLDIGHGGASFSFKVAEAAIKRGLLPFSISTDLHDHSMNFPVWDLATTMSKLLVVGMPFDKVVEAVTQAPASVIKLPMENRLANRRTGRFHHLRSCRFRYRSNGFQWRRLAYSPGCSSRAMPSSAPRRSRPAATFRARASSCATATAIPTGNRAIFSHSRTQEFA
jgi:hypothetical protein